MAEGGFAGVVALPDNEDRRIEAPAPCRLMGQAAERGFRAAGKVCSNVLMDATAEGIETKEPCEALKRQRCPAAQGHLSGAGHLSAGRSRR